MTREDKESGVDMAFDALMDLEENSDLSSFMKNFDYSEDPSDIWTQLDDNTLITNKATQQVLEDGNLYQTKQASSIINSEG